MEEPQRTIVRRLAGFLLYFAAGAFLLPQAVQWDGLGFLAWSREPLHLDFGHLFYVPMLRASRFVFAPLTADAVEAAQLLSVAGGALAFVLLWDRLEEAATTRFALTGALLVTTTPLFWNQAGTIEPSTLTLAALLLSARAAARYGRTRTVRAALLVSLSLALLFGLHVVSVLALPWLVFLARGPARRPPASHLLVPVTLALAVVLGLVFAGYGHPLRRFPAYWAGFLPEASLASVAGHVGHGFALALDPGEGFLPLAVVGLGSALLLGLRLRAHPAAYLLAVPYLGAFAVLGKPLVGLLLPVTLALGLFFGAACAATDLRAARRKLVLAAGFALVLQLGVGLARGIERRRTPDERRVQAELFAAALPPDSAMVVGSIGHHVLWFTDAPAVVLPDELHARSLAGEADVLAFVQELARREAETFERVYLTTEAVEYLDWRWNADALALPLDWEEGIEVPGRPDLQLVPFRPLR